ncbi:MAG: Crp/Fnr family transcriptional regulator [Zoogloeaceae bacterium]|nr:Crp/Fnr family transcriptional regulator [Rhodocyclaceae bacterium]MCP5235789.1 Crp/Fnr family transcriptional regulator [Zoogloeaceae bacterium]
MKRVSAETLNAVDVFKDLEIDERRVLAEQVVVRTYARNKQVVAQDDDSKDIYFVISGKVRARVFSVSGKEVDYQDLGPGEMFGELAAIDGQVRSAYVDTLAESTIASMPCEAFWTALMEHPSVARRTLLRLSGLVRMHCERIFEFSTFSVNNRIHAELLRLARDASTRQFDIEVIDPPTHAEIASRVATHREAVTRELKHLEALGLIDWRPRCHVIRDVGALQALVDEVRGH